YYVNTHSLNVRSGEGLWKSGIKSVLYRGEEVTVIQDAAKGWKKIQLKDGSTGFVNGKYLIDKAPELKYFSNEGKTWNKVKVNVYSAFVRLDSQKKPIAVVRLNEELQVIGEYSPISGWIKVKITDTNSKYFGKEGYIGQKLIDAIEFSNITNERSLDSTYYSSTSNNYNNQYKSNDYLYGNSSTYSQKVKYKIVDRNISKEIKGNIDEEIIVDNDFEYKTQILNESLFSSNNNEEISKENTEELENSKNTEIFDEMGDIDLEALFSDL
ncbi:MAG: SH3 domain-containing protein, partial [Candidatus Absconditabacteria bacterium]